MTNSKPRTQDWKGIVIHSMSELIGGMPAKAFLQSIGLSAHYFINANGIVSQQASLDHIAYHAGVSRWKGMTHLNQNFIGIELLIEGDLSYGEFIETIRHPQAFTENHYDSAAKLCYSMLSQYPTIEMDNIVAHSEVSGKDVRPKDPKYDPGKGFNMNRLLSKIKNITS